MSYTYCSTCHDAICTCGEKYKGMDVEELNGMIAMLGKLRDEAIQRRENPPSPEAVRAWVREQQLQHPYRPGRVRSH